MAETVEMQYKVCAMCNVSKPHADYHKNTRRGKPTVQSKCKPCMSEYKKQRYWGNHDEELAKMTKSRLKPENVAQRRGYYLSNKKSYQERHSKLMSDEQKKLNRRAKSKEYEKRKAKEIAEKKRVHNQKPEVKAQIRKRHHEKKEKDIQYVIKRRLRFRLRHEMKRGGEKKFEKSYSTFDLVGCSFDELKNHIQSLFTEGMNWDKVLSAEIELDHKRPCASFDLTNIEEQKKCFHYTNLQPLWALDNRSKNSLYAGKYIRNRAA